MKTLAQFEADRMAEICAEYNVSKAEYLELYPPGSRRDEWIQYLESEAKAGHIFTKPVCRSIVEHTGDLAYWQKFFRCVPSDVLFATGLTA